MTDFNYLEDDLLDWAATQHPLEQYERELLETVRDHYLPELEAAIWKLAAANVTNA